MGLVRAGSHLVKLPAEPRAALDALHAAEVGIYRLKEEPVSVEYSAIFPAADRAMKARGWERMVAVVQRDEFVVVYLPRKGVSLENMACCVMVLQGRDLVVASVRGNPQPLLELAAKEGRWRIGEKRSEIGKRWAGFELRTWMGAS